MPSKLDFFLDQLSDTLDVADNLDFPFHHLSLHFKHPSGRMLHQTARGPSDIPARVAAMPGWDAYICPQPHKVLGKPSLSDIRWVYWAVLDIDPLLPTTEPIDTEILDGVTDQLHVKLDIPYGSLTTIFTGRGAQIWLPTSPEPGHILRDFQHTLNEAGIFDYLNHCGFAIDPTCFEASHIFRLPNSINTKTSKLAEIWYTPAHYMPLVLSDYVTAAPPPPTAAPRGAEAPSNLGSILTSVSPQARDFLAFGARAPQSRHRQAFIACAQLQELGVPLDTAKPLVASAAEACSPHLTDWEAILVRTYARNREST